LWKKKRRKKPTRMKKDRIKGGDATLTERKLRGGFIKQEQKQQKERREEVQRDRERGKTVSGKHETGFDLSRK